MRSNLFAEFDSQVVGCRRLETWGCLALRDADSKEDGENCVQQHDSILILIDLSQTWPNDDLKTDQNN